MGAQVPEPFPLKLNPPLVSNGDVASTVRVTPDGDTVIYVADQEVDGRYEIYAVPLEGGTALKLSGPLVAGGTVETNFQISPDGTTLVYRAVQDTANTMELYSVPITGGPTVRLNDALPSGGFVVRSEISPDGLTVVYLARTGSSAPYELYGVPIQGGTPVKLNGTLPPGGQVSLNVLGFTPDSSRLVYAADEQTPGVVELFSISPEGNDPLKISGAFGPGEEVQDYVGITMSPDGQTVLYQAGNSGTGDIDLFRTHLNSGGAVAVNAPLAGSTVVLSSRGQFSEDGSRIIFRALQSGGSGVELFSAPTNGFGSVVTLNPALPPGGGVDAFEVAGQRVVYRSNHEVPSNDELFMVPAAGGSSVKLSGPMTPGGDVQSFRISPDGSHVVYQADQDTDQLFELYSAPVAGGSWVRISPPIQGSAASFSMRFFSPDGSRLLFTGDPDSQSKLDAYSVPVTGGLASKLSDLPSPGRDMNAAAITPDGSRVLCVGNQDDQAFTELYATRVESVWASAGGSWFTGSNWSDGVGPTDLLSSAVHDAPGTLSIDSLLSAAIANDLELGSGNALGGRSILALRSGSALGLSGRLTIYSGGVLQGNGVLSAPASETHVWPGGEVLVGPAEKLNVHGTSFTNEGRLEAFGNGFATAQLEIGSPCVNAAITGVISARDAILRLPQGLVNEGTITMSSGYNEIVGDLANVTGGRVVVTGGATAVFHEDVSNAGSFQASASGSLTSTVIFLGDFSGNGVSGGGNVFIEGDSRPGFSPGLMSFGGDLGYGALATLSIELGGTAPGTEYDRLVVDGHLELSGELSVSLINGFVPEVGQSFDLWDADSIGGAFASVSLPPLPAGRFWRTEELLTEGLLVIAPTPETYDEFSVYHSLTQGFEGDDDADGLANGVEYALGLDPTVTGFGPAPLGLSRIGTTDVLSVTVSHPLPTDVILSVETSESLVAPWDVLTAKDGGSWTPPEPVELTVLENGYATLHVTHAPSNDPRRFYRLQVIRTE